MSLTTLVNTGASSNRVDLIFMGDGYTVEETDTYLSHISGFIDYLFSDDVKTDPFHQYENFFNVHYITTPSNESGVDDPSNGIYRDTALGASYKYDGVTDRVLYVNSGQAYMTTRSLIDGTDIGAEMRLVTTNSDKYGGAGGYYAVYAGGNHAAYELALHELGHSFAGLADEYGYGGPRTYSGTEPSAPNSTTDPDGSKWAHWMGYDDPNLGEVGVYQGSSYSKYGAYRPTENSKMRSLNKPFDPIAKEAFILQFYEHVDPLDDWTGRNGLMSLLDPLGLSVTPIDPDVIDLEWSVNGTVVAGDTLTFSVADYNLQEGTHTISARAFDNTGLVRRDLDMTTQTVDWTVTVSAPVYILIGGGSGSEHLLGSAAKEEILAAAGDDWIETHGGGDKVDGGAGIDTLSYAWAATSVVANLETGVASVGATRDLIRNIENLQGSADADTLIGDEGANALEGNDGADHFEGGAGNDHVLAGPGADHALLGDGDDLAEGGEGNDELHGGAGNDRLFGGAGEDYLEGNLGEDLVHGGTGDDIVRGRAGADALHGGGGDDDLFGGLGADVIYGHDGADQARGGDDQDLVYGGAGDDRVFGGAGDDTLFGDSGQDRLFGGYGADRLNGGRADDVLIGGNLDEGGDGAADVFIFGSVGAGENGIDRILDFEDGLDRLDLSKLGLSDFETDLRPLAQDSAEGLRIDFGAGDLLIIETLALANFDAQDVML